VHAQIALQARMQPQAVAVQLDDASLTYAELDTRANRLAHRLVALGVRPDDRVAVAAERRIETVVGLLAVMKAGGAYVPVDPSYPVERIAFMLADAAPVAVLARPGALAARHAAGLPVVSLDDAHAEQPAHEPVVADLRPEHLAYVIYTSGSTGRPKGVAVHHAGLTASNAARRQHYAPIGAALLLPSLSFDSSVRCCSGR
jgi:non-ribosomal peptide synthetase component F